MNIKRNDIKRKNGVKGLKGSNECFCELDETSFYPPEDDRVYKSGVDDVHDGDNFYDFAEMFWDLYEDEIYG